MSRNGSTVVDTVLGRTRQNKKSTLLNHTQTHTRNTVIKVFSSPNAYHMCENKIIELTELSCLKATLILFISSDANSSLKITLTYPQL